MDGIEQTPSDGKVATKRSYTLAEDRIVDRWYETRHVPWMLRRSDWYATAVITAGRVLHRLHPSRRFDAVAQVELEWLLYSTGDERKMILVQLPQRKTLPDWLSDLERLAVLSGETGGATLQTIAALKRWRPDESEPSAAARSMLHRKLYEELEPLLRQAMRDERATRKVPDRRRGVASPLSDMGA